jgi:hypothetical protein
MKPDFNVMTKAELRAYVLEHREDAEAFEALADRIYANPNPLGSSDKSPCHPPIQNRAC